MSENIYWCIWIAAFLKTELLCLLQDCMWLSCVVQLTVGCMSVELYVPCVSSCTWSGESGDSAAGFGVVGEDGKQMKVVPFNSNREEENNQNIYNN